MDMIGLVLIFESKLLDGIFLYLLAGGWSFCKRESSRISIIKLCDIAI